MPKVPDYHAEMMVRSQAAYSNALFQFFEFYAKPMPLSIGLVCLIIYGGECQQFCL